MANFGCGHTMEWTNIFLDADHVAHCIACVKVGQITPVQITGTPTASKRNVKVHPNAKVQIPRDKPVMDMTPDERREHARAYAREYARIKREEEKQAKGEQPTEAKTDEVTTQPVEQESASTPEPQEAREPMTAEELDRKKKAAYARRYYAQNRERILAEAKAKNHANREAQRAEIFQKQQSQNA